MDFADRIRELAARIPQQLEYIKTEEATKNALVLPFINALGYNVFDPTEVVPEFTADVGIKKGEKVDYAILRDGQPAILIECKPAGGDLDLNHASQLFRYFHTTTARFSILTNGIVYRFFTDLDAPNKMDSKSFLEFNMLDIEERLLDELKKFSKSSFDVGSILNTATELRYTREIKQVLTQQMQDPDPDFVRFFMSRVYEGRSTTQMREQFTEMTKRALRQFIGDQLNERLKSALGHDAPTVIPAVQAAAEPEATTLDAEKVVTTEEEREAFYIIRAILRETVDVGRVAIRDQQSYCGILLDNNNRKPLARLRFGKTRRQLGIFDSERKEQLVTIESLDDIYQHADELKAALSVYEAPKQG
jgi:hypothetical protein